MSEHDVKLQEQAKELAEKFGDFVNHFHGESAQKLFNEYLSREHRTLQQNMMRMMFGYIEYCATDEYRTDGRNEQTKKVCQEIVKAFEALPQHEGTKPSQWLSFI